MALDGCRIDRFALPLYLNMRISPVRIATPIGTAFRAFYAIVLRESCCFFDQFPPFIPVDLQGKDLKCIQIQNAHIILPPESSGR